MGVDQTLDTGSIDCCYSREVEYHSAQDRASVVGNGFNAKALARPDIVPGTVAQRRVGVGLAALGDPLDFVDDEIDLCGCVGVGERFGRAEDDDAWGRLLDFGIRVEEAFVDWDPNIARLFADSETDTAEELTTWAGDAVQKETGRCCCGGWW